MKKPRIFINMHYMELGGAERALIGLLNAIDTDRVEVDLFLNQHTGVFMPLIPKKINLLPEIPAYAAIESPFQQQIVKSMRLMFHWRVVDAFQICGVLFGRLWAKIKYLRYKRKVGSENEGSATQYAFDGVIRFLPSLKKYGRYALAVSFLDPPHVVQDKVDAEKRIEWIHTDFSMVKMDVEKCGMRWRRNDHIASISSTVTQQFLKTFPGLEDKIVEIQNILSPVFVREQAKEECAAFSADNNVLRLCSVGRICYAKNYECIPNVARLLKEKGLKFKWIIVGPGEHQNIDAEAKMLRVDGCVEFVGASDNPYPYISNCDIYVQPSRFEGNSVTVREAQMLCRPVIITNYATAANQVRDGVDGIICDMKEEDVADAIYSLAMDKDKQYSIINYLKSHDYGNEGDVEKIYKLIGL